MVVTREKGSRAGTETAVLPMLLLLRSVRIATLSLLARKILQKFSECILQKSFHKSYYISDSMIPFGGMKQSGFGRENGVAALEAFSQVKSVFVNASNKLNNPFVC